MNVTAASVLLPQLAQSPAKAFEERIVALAENDKLEHCVRQYNTMLTEGWPPTPAVHAAMIEAHGRRGDVAGARAHARLLATLPADAAALAHAAKWSK